MATWIAANEGAVVRAVQARAGSRACRVCGCASVSLDEVVCDGPLVLGECAHCGHRFTERPAPRSAPARVRRARVRRREPARAA